MSWTSYQIRKIAGCACVGNAGNVSPRHRLQRKTLVSDPVMHHGTCVTHVPWCMSGSLTRCGEEIVPGIPDACAPAILRIWQEAHCLSLGYIIDHISKMYILALWQSWNNMIIFMHMPHVLSVTIITVVFWMIVTLKHTLRDCAFYSM